MIFLVTTKFSRFYCGKQQNHVHIVKRGDSLSKISARYNVTINSLKRLNNLKRNTVVVGQKIRLPNGARMPANVSAKKTTHKVRRGDTLSEIAQAYGSSIKKIMHAEIVRCTMCTIAEHRCEVGLCQAVGWPAFFPETPATSNTVGWVFRPTTSAISGAAP